MSSRCPAPAGPLAAVRQRGGEGGRRIAVGSDADGTARRTRRASPDRADAFRCTSALRAIASGRRSPTLVEARRAPAWAGVPSARPQLWRSRRSAPAGGQAGARRACARRGEDEQGRGAGKRGDRPDDSRDAFQRDPSRPRGVRSLLPARRSHCPKSRLQRQSRHSV